MSKQDFIDAGITAKNLAQDVRNGSNIEEVKEKAAQKLGMDGARMFELLIQLFPNNPDQVAAMLEKIAKFVEQSQEKFNKAIIRKNKEATEEQKAAAEAAEAAASKAAAEIQARQEALNDSLSDLKKLEKNKKRNAEERKKLAEKKKKLAEERKKAKAKRQQKIDEELRKIAQKEQELTTSDSQNNQAIIAKTEEVRLRREHLENLKKKQQEKTQARTSESRQEQSPTIDRTISPLMQMGNLDRS